MLAIAKALKSTPFFFFGKIGGLVVEESGAESKRKLLFGFGLT